MTSESGFQAMPTPVTTNEFLDLIQKSGLLDEATLSTLHKEELPSSPIDCARALIKRDILTRYQAQQLLAGKYKGLRFDRLKILDRIGQGGMGAVFLCEHLSLRRKVAVKILTPDVSNDPGRKERFLREARASAALDHPNIVQVFDLSSSGGLLYLVMEYIEGQDLQSWIGKNGPMPIDQAAGYISQAAAGLSHAHSKGLVHRDIKPANLLLDNNGVVKILDLGLARFSDDKSDNLTEKFDRGAVLGTADYMAPEQIIASSKVDSRADIYSLGVTLYSLVSGKPPFGGNSTQKMIGHQTHIATPLSSLRPDVPKGFGKVVAKMMQKNPDDRYQTADEVIEALAPWMSEDSQPDPKTGVRVSAPSNIRAGKKSKIQKKKSPLPLIITIAILGLLLVGGGIGAAVYFSKEEPNAPVVQNPPDDTPPPKKDPEDPKKKDPEDPKKKDPVDPKKVDPPKKDPPKKDPLAPHTSKVFKVGFDNIPEWKTEIDAGSGIDGRSDSRVPKEYLVNVWDKEAKAIVGVQKFLGEPVFMMQNTQKASVQIFQLASHLAVEKGTPVGVRVTYATPAQTEGTNPKTDVGVIEVRQDKNNLISAKLSSTNGKWQTIEAVVPAPEKMNLKVFVQSTLWGEESLMYVRSIELFQTKEPIGKSIYPNFIPKLEPFSQTRNKDEVIMSNGKGDFPKGWISNTWRQNAQATFSVEDVAGEKAFRIQNEMQNSAQLLSYNGMIEVKKNKRYRVRVTYRSGENTTGNIGIRVDNGAPGPDVWTLALRKNVTEWMTTDAIVVPNRDGKLNVLIRNFGTDSGNFILVKQIEVFELDPYE